MILVLLGLVSGFCSSWLGVGGSVFIVPLLPFLTELDPLSSARLSLLLILSLSFLNSGAFISQRLLLWNWFWRGGAVALPFSFISSFVLTFLSPFQIRFILWLFLGLILSLAFLLKKFPFLRDRGFYIFSSIMGVCSGGTGLGGGMILSPFLYESGLIPIKNIPAMACGIMFPVSLFALLGHISRESFSFIPSSYPYFLLLFIPSCIGLTLGHVANLRQRNIRWRRLILRAVVGLMFLKLSLEMVKNLVQENLKF